jgi:hypothetical protein
MGHPSIRVITLLAVGILLAGCRKTSADPLSDPTPSAGIWAGYLSATATSDGIRVTNQTERPVSYAAFEQQTDGEVLFLACAGGPQCPSLAPGATRVLPWSDVGGYDPARNRFVLYWWQIVTEPDGTIHGGPLQTVTLSR